MYIYICIYMYIYIVLRICIILPEFLYFWCMRFISDHAGFLAPTAWDPYERAARLHVDWKMRLQHFKRSNSQASSYCPDIHS